MPMDPKKYAVIRKYLEDAFQVKGQSKGPVIEEADDPERDTWLFKIPMRRGPSPLVAFSDVFIDDHEPGAIGAFLEDWGISELMKKHPDKRILVTSHGPKIEPRS